MSEFAMYKEQVLAAYDQKKAAGELPMEMNDPTAAALKDECLRRCEDDFDEKCKKVLESFFDKKEDLGAYRKAIREEGVDKCRPLYNFLKDRSINTNNKNIELLAWLIGFEPRPYVLWQKYPGRHHQKIAMEAEKIPLPKLTGVGKAGQVNPAPYRKRIGVVLLMIIVFIGAGGYWKWHAGPPKPDTTQDTISKVVQNNSPAGCMVWNEDHYQQAPCEPRDDGRMVMALDTYSFSHLKKISDLTGIKESDVGKVWYFKKEKNLECFTSAGSYPLDTNRRLLPLSAYMFNKYIRHLAGNK